MKRFTCLIMSAVLLCGFACTRVATAYLASRIAPTLASTPKP